MTDNINDQNLEIPDFLRSKSYESTTVEETKEKESFGAVPPKDCSVLGRQYSEEDYKEAKRRKIDTRWLKRTIQEEAYMYVKENKAVGKNILLGYLKYHIENKFKEKFKHNNFELTQKHISRCISRLKHNRVFATKTYNGWHGKLIIGDYPINRFRVTKIKGRI